MLAIAPGQGTQRHLLRDTEEGLRVAFIGHVVQRVTEHQQSPLHLSASPGSDWMGKGHMESQGGAQSLGFVFMVL